MDRTFRWTDKVNHYFRDNLSLKNAYIIYASFLMDSMIITYITLFAFYWKTYRVILAYIMFFAIRTFIQVSTRNLMFLENFLHVQTWWFFVGLPRSLLHVGPLSRYERLFLFGTHRHLHANDPRILVSQVVQDVLLHVIYPPEPMGADDFRQNSLHYWPRGRPYYGSLLPYGFWMAYLLLWCLGSGKPQWLEVQLLLQTMWVLWLVQQECIFLHGSFWGKDN